jgi:hypothetical protein
MSINKELSLIRYQRTEEKNLTTQLKEACSFLYNKNRSFDYSSSMVEPKIEPLGAPKLFGFIAFYNQFQILKQWI